MLNKPINAVTSFHEAYGLGIEHKPTVSVPDHISMLRFNLMKEENEEYLEAVKEGDLIEVGDALGDMLYILCGTIIAHGFQEKIEAIFDEIQKSNMSKLDENGKPIYRGDGKVMKGPNYFKPDLKKILKTD
jgi:predicted HAD superfamily Cof-like phosphohydrolase